MYSMKWLVSRDLGRDISRPGQLIFSCYYHIGETNQRLKMGLYPFGINNPNCSVVEFIRNESVGNLVLIGECYLFDDSGVLSKIDVRLPFKQGVHSLRRHWFAQDIFRKQLPNLYLQFKYTLGNPNEPLKFVEVQTPTERASGSSSSWTSDRSVKSGPSEITMSEDICQESRGFQPTSFSLDSLRSPHLDEKAESRPSASRTTYVNEQILKSLQNVHVNPDSIKKGDKVGEESSSDEEFVKIELG